MNRTLRYFAKKDKSQFNLNPNKLIGTQNNAPFFVLHQITNINAGAKFFDACLALDAYGHPAFLVDWPGYVIALTNLDQSNFKWNDGAVHVE